ncbi:MAG: dienelactone hydrolase family protein [Steroidobacteraceae bacterium]
MGEFTTLMARDGHEFNAWLVAPTGTPRGALVVIQEIFGVNSHIRSVADGYAAEGYVVIAPCFFDRVRRGIELGYSAEDVQEGRGYAQQLEQDKVSKDLAAAIAVTRHAGRVGVVGYCWGGTQAFIAAGTQPIAAAVAYYGGGIAANLDKRPKHPVLYHFGDRDQHISAEACEKIAAADPANAVHVYAADHGFNCDQRASYEPASAQLARQRTLEFFAQHLG